MADAFKQVDDLHLVRLTKRYGEHAAVDDLTLTIPAGSFFALLGPSGCGKTTTLRMVAGLEVPSEGMIRIGEQDITHLRPFKRPVNTVFQSYALFPHMDIFENVAFGLRRRGEKNVELRVNEMLDLVELGPMARRRPAQLSGGQQQRVAVARALINRPDVLLLDEPLGALDLKLRRQMQIELKRIQTEVGITFVHVTHDQEEAMTMADTIAVMNQGRIEQLGAPQDIYDTPHTAFAANFLGQSNMLPGEVVGRDGIVTVRAFGQVVRLPQEKVSTDADRIIVGVRPEKLHLHREGTEVPAGRNTLDGVVTDASFVGVSTQYLVATSWGQELIAFEQNMGSATRPAVGERVVVSWEPGHSFGLDGGDDLNAGIEEDLREVGHYTASDAQAGLAPTPAVGG
ncbi:MAG: ABC transporter ATP-binding protein [Candidatus Nanopelagicales bacterium]|jgi:spermidine/putrescine transport system ATP-binding protein|nr:ABC transporter ATP-binding protein [Candidatus Nanopelagicales bacterium]